MFLVSFDLESRIKKILKEHVNENNAIELLSSTINFITIFDRTEFFIPRKK